MAKTPELKDYVATSDGWVDGQRVKKGDKLRMSEARAKYEPVILAPDASATPRAKSKGADA